MPPESFPGVLVIDLKRNRHRDGFFSTAFTAAPKRRIEIYVAAITTPPLILSA